MADKKPDMKVDSRADYKDDKSLSAEFDKLNKQVDDIFSKPVPYEDLDDPAFIDLVSKFREAGVDFLEINNQRLFAIAKHENFYEYPERRYALVQEPKGRVRFYELLFSNTDMKSNAREISQSEFEEFTIPTYLKDNDVSNKYNKFPRELEDYNTPKQDKAKNKTKFGETGKEESDKDTQKPADDTVKEPNEVVTAENKKYTALQSYCLFNEEAVTQSAIGKIVSAPPYTGSVGNVGPMEEEDEEDIEEMAVPKGTKRIDDAADDVIDAFADLQEPGSNTIRHSSVQEYLRSSDYASEIVDDFVYDVIEKLTQKGYDVV